MTDKWDKFKEELEPIRSYESGYTEKSVWKLCREGDKLREKADKINAVWKLIDAERQQKKIAPITVLYHRRSELLDTLWEILKDE